MRFHIAHYSFLALAAVWIAGCSSDRATAPNVQAGEIKGPSADLIDLTETPVLYNQTKLTILSDNIGDFDKTSYLADDFIVPAGAVWTIADVGIIGTVPKGFLTFSIQADAAGQPGASMPNSNVSLQPSVTRNFGLPWLNNLLFTLPTAIRLPAGKYWLAITADAFFQATWGRHDGVVNSSALGSQDGGATWQSRGNDYMFAVFGTSVFTQTITFPSITPNPALVSGSTPLGATASSGLTVSYRSLTTNVCTVSGTTVSYDNVGTCTIAADQAGNDAYSAAASVTQSVKVDYRYDGFLGSVKNGDVLNVAKAGQVIPLQWRLTDASGAPITTLSSVKITVTNLGCPLGASGDQIAEQATGASGLQNLGNGYYQYNWKAPASYANSCKTLQLDLGEGSGVRSARFAFAK